MYPYLLIKKKGKRMKEKAVGLWNRIAAKENKQIAKNVLLILLVSRLFYIFIGCVTNSAFGNNITFAKMFLGGDADWYIKIAEKDIVFLEA